MTGNNKKKGQRANGGRRAGTAPQSPPVDPVMAEAEQARRRSLALFAELLKERPTSGSTGISEEASTQQASAGIGGAGPRSDQQQTDAGASTLMLEEVRPRPPCSHGEA
jgi:hypothetical protein